MNELAWPFPADHYIGTPNDLGWCHYSGDAITTLRVLLGVDGEGDFNDDDKAAVVAWHVENTGSHLTVIRMQDWQALVDARFVEDEPEKPAQKAKTSRRRAG